MNDLRAKLTWFEEVILPHQAALRARLARIIQSSQDLDDTLSEVLARAWAAADWDRIDRGRAYLFSIARNLVIDNARRSKVVAFDQIADLDMLQAHTSMERQLQARAELRWLQDFLPRLPRQCRRIFYKRRIEEKSMRLIAGEMELSVSTVEKHLAKALLLIMQARWQREECGFERGTAEPTEPTEPAGDRGSGLASCRSLS